MRFRIVYTKRTHEEIIESETEETFESWAALIAWAEQFEQAGCECWYEISKFERVA